jgi:hypothetical protein
MRMWQMGVRRDRRVALVFSLALLTGAFLISSPPPACAAAEETKDCNCHVSVGAVNGQVCVTVVCDGKLTGGAVVTGNGQSCTTDAVTGQCCLNLGEGTHTIVVSMSGCNPIIRNVKVDKECGGDIKILPVPVPGMLSTLTEKDIVEHQSVYYHDGRQIKGSSPSSVRMVLAFSDPEGDGILTAEVREYTSVYPEAVSGGITIRQIKATLDPDHRSFLFFNPEEGRVWGEVWTRLDSSMFTQGTRGYQQITGTWDGGSDVKFRSTSQITEGGLSLSGLLFGDAEQ